MTTTNKNFKVKNGLDVAGNATFDSNVVLGQTPLRFDTVTNKLQIELNGNWVPVAFISDIPDTTNNISFMDIGLRKIIEKPMGCLHRRVFYSITNRRAVVQHSSLAKSQLH